MPGLDGIEATRRIVAASDGAIRVLMLTTFGNDAYVFDSLRAGASGFCSGTPRPKICWPRSRPSHAATRCSRRPAH